MKQIVINFPDDGYTDNGFGPLRADGSPSRFDAHGQQARQRILEQIQYAIEEAIVQTNTNVGPGEGPDSVRILVTPDTPEWIQQMEYKPPHEEGEWWVIAEWDYEEPAPIYWNVGEDGEGCWSSWV